MWFCYVSFSFLSVRNEEIGLGETSPKWPVLCRVARKTTTQSMVAMQRGCECEGGMGGGAQEACSDSSVWASRLHCSTDSACWPRESASCCKLLLLLLTRCQQQQQQHHWPDAWLIATARPSVASPGFSAAAGRSTEVRLPRMESLACPVHRDQRNWSELRPA